MTTITHVRTLDYAAKMLGEDVELETRKNGVISSEAGWFDDVEASGRTKGIVRTNFHYARR